MKTDYKKNRDPWIGLHLGRGPYWNDRQFKIRMEENCKGRRELRHTRVSYRSFKRGLKPKWSSYQVNACVVRPKSKTRRKLTEYENGGGARTKRSVAHNIIRGLLMVFPGLI